MLARKWNAVLKAGYIETFFKSKKDWTEFHEKNKNEIENIFISLPNNRNVFCIDKRKEQGKPKSWWFGVNSNKVLTVSEGEIKKRTTEYVKMICFFETYKKTVLVDFYKSKIIYQKYENVIKK